MPLAEPLPSALERLSVTRKTDRLQMAELVAQLAGEFGCEVETATGGTYPGKRCIAVSLAAPGGLCVRVSFDADSCLGESYVLSWYIAPSSPARLDPRFGEVNPHHFCKATHVAHGFEQLMRVLHRGLSMARDGSAYQAA